MSTSKRASSAGNSTPEVPMSSPDMLATSQPGHDFVLQAVMQMQHTLGELKSDVKGAVKTIDSHGRKIDDLVRWKHVIFGVALVVGAIAGTVGTLALKWADRISWVAPTPGSTPAVVSSPTTAAQVPASPASR